jgi:hypothetical protein
MVGDPAITVEPIEVPTSVEAMCELVNGIPAPQARTAQRGLRD